MSCIFTLTLVLIKLFVFESRSGRGHLFYLRNNQYLNEKLKNFFFNYNLFLLLDIILTSLWKPIQQIKLRWVKKKTFLGQQINKLQAWIL